MKHRFVTLRAASLMLGLLLALGTSARANGAPCPTPVTTGAINFGSAAAGQIGNEIFLTFPGNVTVTALGGNFLVLTNCPTGTATCGAVVVFTPPTIACGTVPGTLLVQDAATGCPLLVIPLTGFACSFRCAINLTSQAAAMGTLSAAGAALILGQLYKAQQIILLDAGVDDEFTVLCPALNCALCLAQAEAAARRPGAAAIIAQIQCLQASFCLRRGMPM